MIRRLHIEGWRAFAHLNLELEDGVTFVVAENGIGKTSLVQAASWGLYGALSGVDPKAALRFGEGRLLVEVDLELPTGELITIERSFTGRAPTVRSRLDGEVVEDTEFADVIANAFGASQDFLSRTTLLASSAVADDSIGGRDPGWDSQLEQYVPPLFDHHLSDSVGLCRDSEHDEMTLSRSTSELAASAKWDTR
jgi:hypothetical protein